MPIFSLVFLEALEDEHKGYFGYLPGLGKTLETPILKRDVVSLLLHPFT